MNDKGIISFLRQPPKKEIRKLVWLILTPTVIFLMIGQIANFIAIHTNEGEMPIIKGGEGDYNFPFLCDWVRISIDSEPSLLTFLFKFENWDKQIKYYLEGETHISVGDVLIYVGRVNILYLLILIIIFFGYSIACFALNKKCSIFRDG